MIEHRELKENTHMSSFFVRQVGCTEMGIHEQIIALEHQVNSGAGGETQFRFEDLYRRNLPAGKTHALGAFLGKPDMATDAQVFLGCTMLTRLEHWPSAQERLGSYFRHMRGEREEAQQFAQTAYAEAQRFKGLQPAPSQRGIYEVFHGSPALLAMLDGSAWLHALAVKPEYRGQKIGLALFNDQLLLAESLGLSGILMSTYNPLVYDMAKKRGFEDMTTFSVEDFDGQNRTEIFRKWNLGMALGGLTFRSNAPQIQYKVEVQLP